MSSVVFGCGKCGKGVEVEPGATDTCLVCLEKNQLRYASEPFSPHVPLDQCLACGNKELYRHRDFNQKLGLFLIGLGAIAWFVWSTFWPLIFAALLDLVLYFTLPDVGICYRCKAHHREFDAISTLPGFDLERHEHYRHVLARKEKSAADTPPQSPDASDAT